MKETFGQRLQSLRKQKGLTQEEIANRVNVSFQAVSKWENDLTSPDIETLIKLSDILDVSLDELMGKEIKKAVELVPEEKRKDINSLMLKIRIEEGQSGEKVNVNLPFGLLKVFLENGKEVPVNFGKNHQSLNIDFAQIMTLVEQGVMGELVNIEGEDGEIIRIYVE